MRCSIKGTAPVDAGEDACKSIGVELLIESDSFFGGEEPSKRPSKALAGGMPTS